MTNDDYDERAALVGMAACCIWTVACLGCGLLVAIVLLRGGLQ